MALGLVSSIIAVAALGIVVVPAGHGIGFTWQLLLDGSFEAWGLLAYLLVFSCGILVSSNLITDERWFGRLGLLSVLLMVGCWLLLVRQSEGKIVTVLSSVPFLIAIAFKFIRCANMLSDDTHLVQPSRLHRGFEVRSPTHENQSPGE